MNEEDIRKRYLDTEMVNGRESELEIITAKNTIASSVSKVESLSHNFP